MRNYSLISNSWSKGTSESLSQKVMGKVRPDEPLKNKLEFAQTKLQSQITKLYNFFPLLINHGHEIHLGDQ